MRNSNIDLLKGFAIFCVVIGHILQNSLTNYDTNCIFRFIYSFHMPLFFFLSGYVNYNSNKNQLIPFITKRIKALLLPFFIWTLLYLILNKSNFDTCINKLLYPDTGYWFLPILFYSIFILAISLYYSKFDIYILLGVSIVFISIDLFLNIKLLGFNLLAKCFPFFIFGYSANKYIEYFKKMDILYWKYFVFMFIIGVSFWMRKEPPLFYKYINLGSFFSFIYKFIVAILGILFLFGLGNRLLVKEINLYWLQNIGKNSLIIYLAHFFFLPYFDLINIEEFYYFNVFIFGLFSIGICLGINNILLLNRTLSLFFLGKVIKKYPAT